MENQQFEVFYLNGLKPGVSEEQAIEHLCQLFKLQCDKAEKIIRATQRVLKTGLSLEQAEKYRAALDRVGLLLEIREIHAEAEPEVSSTVERTSEDDSSNENRDRDDLGKSNESATVEQSPVKAQADPGANEEYKAIQVEFNGRELEYFKIWIVNIFLTIVTLGIYSAWAKVRNTQYFYGNTLIDGSSFNYTANPIVILKGRLIAVAFFVLYAVVNQFLPILGLLFFLVILLLIPWVVVRSLAFNARNSVYRNIRFNFSGQVGEAARVFILWPMLIPLTLGLIFPYIWFRQRQFIIANSSYGTMGFKFHASAGDYYRIFLMLFGILIAGGLLAAAISAVGQMIHPALTFISGPVVFAAYLFMISYHVTATSNLQFNSTTISHHSFSMNLRTRQVAWLYFINTLGILLTLGLLIPWAQVRMARYRAQCLQLHVLGSLDHFIADEQEHVSALGEQVGDVFDMEVSVI